MKRATYKFLTGLLILSFMKLSAQMDYYYYFGEKQYMQLDRSRVTIHCSGTLSKEIVSDIFLDEIWEVIPFLTEDNARTFVTPTDPVSERRKEIKTSYFELENQRDISVNDYLNRLNVLKNKPGIITVAPCFIKKNGLRSGLTANLYVQLNHSRDVKLLYEKANELKLEVLGKNKYMPLWYTLSCTRTTGWNALEVANQLQESGLFASAEPEFITELKQTSIPNDTYFSNQWYLKNTGQNGGIAGIDIKAEQAWNLPTGIGSSNIITAIYDFGIQGSHPDLQANLSLPGFDPHLNSPIIVNDHWFAPHGTNMAGILAGVQNNNIGISGVAPGTKFKNLITNLVFTPAVVTAAFNFAANNADILSCSFIFDASNFLISSINSAVANGRAGKGLIVVCSSGNFNFSLGEQPWQNLDSRVLIVGGVDRCGTRCGNISTSPQSCNPWPSPQGSSYGPGLDVVACGSEILTTNPVNSPLPIGALPAPPNYIIADGTSEATPMVAAIAALMLSANPNLTSQQVSDFIEQTAQKVRPDLYTYSNTVGRTNGLWNNELGYGLVNAYQAVIKALNTVCGITNLNITANVNSPQIDDKQATNSITASNIINSGASGRYHAGDEVHLANGFSAVYNSYFHAYPEGCSSLFNRQTNSINYHDEPLEVNLTQDEAIFEEKTLGLQVKSINKKLEASIVPNPSSGRFTIYLNSGQQAPESIVIMDAVGKIVNEIKFPNTTTYSFNLEDEADGIYFIKFTYLDDILIKRFVKGE